jgi:hypothetical protein
MALLRRELLLPLLRGALCTLSTAHRPLLAQPAFFQPGTDYYRAKGFAVRVKWEVPERTVQEGRDLAATLVVTGATNPTEVEKPDLAKLPEFAKRFAVTNLPDPPRQPDDKEVQFRYALRPRSRSVAQVPALEFKFQSLAAAPGKNPFRSARAESVPIAVTEPPKPPPVPMPEDGHLFHVATGERVLHAPFMPCGWAWAAAALFGPLAALAWFLAWRRIYPDAARLARLHRSRAARRATDAIRRANRTPDPPAAVAAALLHYLRARFPLPESAVTPSEIAAALAEANVPEEVAGQTAGVFRDCDRARFAPPGDRGLSLADEAHAALTRLEEIA